MLPIDYILLTDIQPLVYIPTERTGRTERMIEHFNRHLTATFGRD